MFGGGGGVKKSAHENHAALTASDPARARVEFSRAALCCRRELQLSKGNARCKIIMGSHGN